MFFSDYKNKRLQCMTDGRNFFDQVVKNDQRIFDDTRKIAAGPGDMYTTGCLLVYGYFKHFHNMIAIDLSKQRALDFHPKAV